MNTAGICHRMKSEYAFALSEDELVIRLRTAKGDVQRVVVFYGDRAFPDNPIRLDPVEMEAAGSTLYHDWWEVRLQESLPRICYYFWIQSGSESAYYFGNEIRESPLVHRSEYYQFPYLNRDDLFTVPQWYQESVMYQIFPDSFAKGRRLSPAGGRPGVFLSKTTDHGDWGKAPGTPALPEVKPEEVVCGSRHGGTIQGIRENLDYLADLGVSCLYLNPIMPAHHWHKYDIIDYFTIDPVFGTEKDLSQLVEACHDRGIRVLLDGVFNHAGEYFFAFRDLMERGEESPYRDWFYQADLPALAVYPPNYAAFGYEPHMPKLNTGNPEVRDYFCRVGQYWIQKFNLDGWRLDVANEVDHGFWRAFRQAVSEVNPHAVLVGEIWEDSNAWLDGTQYHSTMNYEFSRVCREFFAEEQISPQTFMEKAQGLLMRYPEQVSGAQMNLLDSHDVPRFMVWCNGLPERMAGAVFFQFTFPGVPSVYMGDELGYTGLEEAEYRKPIEWDKPAPVPEFAELYRRLITIRREDPVLQYGSYRPWAGDHPHRVIGFWRIIPPGENPKHPKNQEPTRGFTAHPRGINPCQGSSNSRLVVINAGHRPYRLSVPPEFQGSSVVDLVSNQRISEGDEITIAPGRGVILRPSDGA
ncbi:glycoside hydrolase family 13 protein [Spirochaeta lutea]|uniref:glycoside hydrolase family 13 protein n=1 Tax=Spirochaeta lutea TaxID=1480694 RepID=UPI00069093C1|nr:glycoside hydrolase family 13 protein [Spirochaeta lutea]